MACHPTVPKFHVRAEGAVSRQQKRRVSGRRREIVGTAGLLLATLAAIPVRAQSHTEVRAGISVGVFDGFGIGMTRYSRTASFDVGATVATGTSGYPDYGIYSGRDRSRRLGDYRYGRGYGRDHDRAYADYCWDRAWDLRWGRGYYGGRGDRWSSSYDHLDFYHDCLGGGIDYADDRWYAHARPASWGRPWCEWSCPRGGVTVAVYVKDPFWAPWGPYWAYDPWGWHWNRYWDGFRGRPGWGPRGRIGYDAVVRTAWTDRGRGWTRTSPLSAPRFKERPTGRTAVPRPGRTIAGADAPATRERPAARMPASAGGEGASAPRVGRTRPTEGLRGRREVGEPRRADEGGRTAPRGRPSTTRGGAERPAPPARGGDRPAVRSGGRRSGGDARPTAPSPSRGSGSGGTATPRRRG